MSSAAPTNYDMMPQNAAGAQTQSSVLWRWLVRLRSRLAERSGNCVCVVLLLTLYRTLSMVLFAVLERYRRVVRHPQRLSPSMLGRRRRDCRAGDRPFRCSLGGPSRSFSLWRCRWDRDRLYYLGCADSFGPWVSAVGGVVVVEKMHWFVPSTCLPYEAQLRVIRWRPQRGLLGNG